MWEVTKELSAIPNEGRQGISSSAKMLSLCLLAFISFGLSSTARAGSLSTAEARKLIARVAGFALKIGAVHVKQVSAVDATTMTATAEIEVAFRLEQNDQKQWRVAEIRSGQDGWEEIAFILQAVKGELNATTCDAPGLGHPKSGSTDVTVRRARCLIANLLGAQLPSDAVRIKSVSPLGLPLVSHQSALVDARLEADFRFTRDKSSWRVNGFKTGSRGWADPEGILNEVNKEKAARAQVELQSIAQALEVFRGQRGFYVESKSEAVLIDFLNPTYLAHLIRLDPWRRPYQYEGTRDHFSLRSRGPDGKENTADDIVLTDPTRSTALTSLSFPG